MKVALYARVSTVNGGQDPELQLRELREHCRARKWDVAGEFIDRASGAKESRPQLDKLMKEAGRRRFDAVLVWKFDRFARSVAHLLRALEQFKSLGIEFVSLTEGVDTSTPMGKMVFTVLGAVAELERSLIVERVKAGMRNAKAKGQHIGRPRFDFDTSAVRARVTAGESQRNIAKSLGVSAAFVNKRMKGSKK